MERKGGRGLPRAQGESPFLWIDLMEERRSRESFLLRAPGRDNLGLSCGSAPGWVAPGHPQMMNYVEFSLRHHGCVREGIPGDALEQWEGEGRTSSRYWAAPLLVP